MQGIMRFQKSQKKIIPPQVLTQEFAIKGLTIYSPCKALLYETHILTELLRLQGRSIFEVTFALSNITQYCY